MKRLFIAATLCQSQTDALMQAQQSLVQQSLSASLTKPNNLHLTLRFLGEVEAELLKYIRRMISQVPIESKEGYTTRLMGCDAFHRTEGKLVFAKLEVSPAITKLVTDLNDALKQLDL